MKEHELLLDYYHMISEYFKWKTTEQFAIINEEPDCVFDTIYERQSYFNGMANMLHQELKQLERL